MPNIKAAEKWVLQSEKREVRNKSVKSRLKTLFKEAAASGDSATARRVESAFDKAAAKGIVHPEQGRPQERPASQGGPTLRHRRSQDR